MKNLIYPMAILLMIGCQPAQEKAEAPQEYEKPYERPPHHSESLTKVFNAHGGHEQWSNMNSLSYLKGEETTITNLKNRKTRLESTNQTIGFDGNEVWVTPDTVDASSIRFYHNLYFYFYAMPFVVGDPGAFYEDVEPREIEEKTYNGIKVSYGENIGDAPDDNYIVWYDPETNKMEWLMYTVTYRNGEPSDQYNLIKYVQWDEFNGLVLPTTLQWYHYAGDSVGDVRGEAIFENVEISKMAPDSSLFEMPEEAQVAPR